MAAVAAEMMAMQPTVKAELVTYKALPQLLWVVVEVGVCWWFSGPKLDRRQPRY